MYIQNKKGLDVRGYIGPAASYRMMPDVPGPLGYDVQQALDGCSSCMGAAKIAFTESLGAADATPKATDWIMPALLAGGVLLIFLGTLKQKGK
jgi:hypothetical protein